MTGEEEDTDVGFPGPEHHIAERDLPMKAAMGVLALGAIVGGALQIPKTTHVIERFLHPTFADSSLYERTPSDSLLATGLVVGALVGIVGIAIAWYVWVARPGTADAIRERFAPLHRFVVNKWYFDEALDVLFVRPATWFGRFAAETFERVVVSGALIGGTTTVVRAGSAAVRAAQNGFLRYYAGLLVVGLSALALYFLLQSS
jgi:NADH-quinone oxidoreductase subunit L